MGQGETLAMSLKKHGLSPQLVHEVAEGLSEVFNFRYARPGDLYRLERDAEGSVQLFEYRQPPLETFVLARDRSDTLRAERVEVEVIDKRSRIAGIVQSSLYDAVTALGENGELAHDFAEIFAWDVDFSRSVQPGDEFSILYVRRHLGENGKPGTYLGPGQVQAARYSTADSDFTALYFETAEDDGGFYRPDGSSVQRQFLRAPLNYRRISSSFSANRLHPILKVRRPHFGIDYAAPTGTPVWAVADGRVTHRGVLGGFGKTVKVRHANGYESYYGHLSSYPKGLSVGDRVTQKQVVGYVGSTGLSTGPHLDFRLKQYDRYVNPATLQFPPGKPIAAEHFGEFEQMRDSLLQQLDPQPLRVATSEAL
jgi:murein DD-endopeptidase MepM/ murein hydrolase activator NlpD